MSGGLAVADFPPADKQYELFRELPAQIYDRPPVEPVSKATRCLLAYHGADPVARLSYETADDLVGLPGWTGLVGHYEALQGSAGVQILRHACQLLSERNLDRVVGPMNGSSWRRHRLVLPLEEGDSEAVPEPFFTEPQNPTDYHRHFREAGFAICAQYESRIALNPGTPRPRAERLAERHRRAGITVRPLDLARFDTEVEALFEFCTIAFAGNRFYRRIRFSEFQCLYQRMYSILDPDLVRLAHGPDGRLLGLAFAVPDLFSDEGARPTRVVLKTLASAPDARRHGLGIRLTDEVHAIASAKGYQAVIHALMHVDNHSAGFSRLYHSRLFRRYALYEWKP